jgi:hypothetical protein
MSIETHRTNSLQLSTATSIHLTSVSERLPRLLKELKAVAHFNMAGLSAEAGLSLLKSGSYADFTIQCKDREFNVHRAIICPESSFFQTMCQSSFKVSQTRSGAQETLLS